METPLLPLAAINPVAVDFTRQMHGQFLRFHKVVAAALQHALGGAIAHLNGTDQVGDRIIGRAV